MSRALPNLLRSHPPGLPAREHVRSRHGRGRPPPGTLRRLPRAVRSPVPALLARRKPVGTPLVGVLLVPVRCSRGDEDTHQGRPYWYECLTINRGLWPASVHAASAT